MQWVARRAVAERRNATLRAQRTLRCAPPQIYVNLLVDFRQSGFAASPLLWIRLALHLAAEVGKV